MIWRLWWWLLFGPLISLSVQGRQLPVKVEHRVDSILRVGLAKGYYPGASVVIGDRNGILFEKCYGFQDAEKKLSVTSEDVYDLASCTKIVATTLAVMHLYDKGQIDVNKRVGDYLNDFRGTVVEGMMLSQLLTHTSGLGNIQLYKLLYRNPSGASLISYRHSRDYPYHVDKSTYLCREMVADTLFLSDTPREGFRTVCSRLYVNPAIDTLITGEIVRSYRPSSRGRYLYSDLNFHLLKMIVEQITGERLDRYVQPMFDRMEMQNTGFRPLEWKDSLHIVPTEYDLLMKRGPLRGYTHDELAAISDNVGGNAGLFSCTADLSHFCEMILNRGVYHGTRILSAETVDLFTSAPLRPKGIYRALGFDRRAPSSPLYDGFGHTGYTGTMIWMDPHKGFYMVFLCNRVHPSRTNRGLTTSGLRTKLWEKLKQAFD